MTKEKKKGERESEKEREKTNKLHVTQWMGFKSRSSGAEEITNDLKKVS